MICFVYMRADVEKAVSLLQRGDDASLEQALALLQSTVFSFSMKVCGHREDAEDTMQEVLLKSIPYLPKIDSPKALVVWLYKVARNRCLMSRRRSKFAPKQDLSLEELMPDRAELEKLSGEGNINPESLAIRSEDAQRLREAVQRLPPSYRIVLVLRDMEGLTDDEVAEITGLRTGTIRVRLHRARLFVRKDLVWHGQQPSNGRFTRRRRVPQQVRTARCKAMFAELSDYLDERLDGSMCEELEKHMDGCEPCQAFIVSLQNAIEQCRKSPLELPDRKKTAKLRKALILEYDRALNQST